MARYWPIAVFSDSVSSSLVSSSKHKGFLTKRGREAVEDSRVFWCCAVLQVRAREGFDVRGCGFGWRGVESC